MIEPRSWGPDRAAPPALPAGHLRGHEVRGRGGDDPGPGSAADAPELWRAGMFHATVRDLTMAARDMAAILHGRPEETDPPEPEKPGETVQKMEKES